MRFGCLSVAKCTRMRGVELVCTHPRASAQHRRHEMHAVACRLAGLHAATCICAASSARNARRCVMSGRTIRNCMRFGCLSVAKCTRMRGVELVCTHPRASAQHRRHEMHAVACRLAGLHAATCICASSARNARRCVSPGGTIRNYMRFGCLSGTKCTRVRGVELVCTHPRAFQNSQITLCYQMTLQL